MKKAYFLIALLVAMATFNAASQIACSVTLVQDSGCLPFPILATPNETTVSPIVQRRWQLSTCSGTVINTSPPGLNVTYSYIPNTAGCYCLRLWTQNQQGDTCVFDYCNIFVSDTPSVDIISVTPNQFCTPQMVTLGMNNTTICGHIDSTRIQWGCGNISYFSGNPTSVNHNYGGNCNIGCYDINVIVHNSCGCTALKKLHNGVCLHSTYADFSVDNASSICLNSLTSHFVADSFESNNTYCWYVNDTLKQCSLIRYFTHTFDSSSACYDIKLVVTGAAIGCVDSIVRPHFICVAPKPHLSFNTNATSACIDSGGNFQLCLYNTTFPRVDVRWIVDGPGVSYGPLVDDTACITLSVLGNYKVTLIVDFGNGCLDTLSNPNYFTLKPNPTPCFYSLDTVSCHNPFCNTFTNCTSAPVGSTYLWNFGYNSTPSASVAASPGVVCYSGYIARDISLTVATPAGCVKNLTRYQYVVTDTIDVAIQVFNQFGCAPLHPVLIAAISNITEPISGYFWQLYYYNSLIITSHSSALPFTANQPGCYQAQLTVSTASGCVQSVYDTCIFAVGVPPVCSLHPSPDTLCLGSDSVVFDINCSGWADRFRVHFGDELNAGASVNFNSLHIVHNYLTYGEFDAWVIPLADSCAGDTLFAHVVVRPPLSNFNSVTSCITGDSVCYQNLSSGANRYHWQFSCVPDTFNTTAVCVSLPPCDTCTATLTAYNDTYHCSNTYKLHHPTACAGVSASFKADTISCSQLPTNFVNTTPGHQSGTTIWNFDTGCGFNCATGDSVFKLFAPGTYHVGMLYIAPGGCRDTVYRTVKVCGLIADFTPISLCLPDSFHFQETAFDNTTSGCDSIVQWFWNFGGGLTSSLPNPTHYFVSGSHPVSLSVTNSVGCTAQVTKTITAQTAVYGHWLVDTIICPGSTVCLYNNTSSGATLTETWNLPGSDVFSYNGHNPPCLTYYNAGDFPVIYQANAGNCVVHDTVGMHVHSPELCGHLTANQFACANPPAAVCGINCSQYVDELTDIYTWNFGNGEYLEINPCNFYTIPGCYPVTLTVLTNNGCKDTVVIDTVCISGPHISSFTVNPTSICPCNDTVNITVGTIAATEVDFAPGGSAGIQIVNNLSPLGTENTPTFVHFNALYCQVDSFWPQITLNDNIGCHTLYNLPWIYVDTPAVDFAINNYGVCVAGNVCFADLTQYAISGDSSTASWLWHFGDPFDNTTSSLPNPCHFYSQPGNYSVTLTVLSKVGCSRSITKQFAINGYPYPKFTYSLVDTCSKATICFNDLSTAEPGTNLVHWYWNFGDGALDSTAANLCHNFSAEGSYATTLGVVDDHGCYSDTILGIQISSIHHLSAHIGIVSRVDSCSFTNICFTDSSTSESVIISRQWNLNGNSTSAVNPCYSFTNSGLHSVGMRVTDNTGCSDSATVTFTTYLHSLHADFTYDATGGTFQFTNTSFGNYVSQIWDFGNGDTSHAPSPVYTYTIPGTYNVSLIIQDAGGCISQISYTIVVVVSDLGAGISSGAVDVEIIPNPFSRYADIKVTGVSGELSFQLKNVIGEEVASKIVAGGQSFRLQREKLAAGLYLYSITKGGKLLQRGKIVIE